MFIDKLSNLFWYSSRLKKAKKLRKEIKKEIKKYYFYLHESDCSFIAKHGRKDVLECYVKMVEDLAKSEIITSSIDAHFALNLQGYLEKQVNDKNLSKFTREIFNIMLNRTGDYNNKTLD